MLRVVTLALAMSAILLPAGPTWAQPDPLVEAFRASEPGRRLSALDTELLFVAPLEGNDVLVAYYVPFQGALSDWDEETRLSVYAREAAGTFRRKAFLGKAGDSIPHRMAGWFARDLDGDGHLEVVAVSPPHGPGHRVKSMVFKRGANEAKYHVVWRRDDVGAALRAEGRALLYTYQSRKAGLDRLFERHELEGGQFVRRAGPQGDPRVWTSRN